jgi:hypothetical protein
LSQSNSSSSSDPYVIPDDDGYTLSRYIEGVSLQYGALRFTYRPVSALRRAKFRDGAKPGDTEETLLRRCAKGVASRLVKWDAVDLKGSPLPTTDAGVLQLHPQLLTRLINVVVYSIEGGDPDPLVVVDSNIDDVFQIGYPAL